METKIQGLVERITFSSDGYGVIKVRVPGRRDLVTAVGNFVSVSPGETLVMEGSWGQHARFGEQFQMEHYEVAMPSTVLGIEKYLGSGLIKGIGPKMAGRIVTRFGERTLDVIDGEIKRLAEVEGVGKYRIEQIRKAWGDQREIRDLMIFLRANEAGAAHAARIFKLYGNDSVGVINENPYRLAMDVTGIGFLTADKLARKLGFAADSPLRAEAGLMYVLHEAAEEGHVCVPSEWLSEQGVKLLDIPATVLEEALPRLAADGRVIIEDLPEGVADAFGGDRAVYLRGYHNAEELAAKRLLFLQRYRGLKPKLAPGAAIAWLKGRLPFDLAEHQEQAVKKAVSDKVIVITGGPGTGKTTLIRAILAVYRKMGARISLAAPTGRAAKKLSETTGHPAATIHRLLEFSPREGGFQRNENRPLSANLVIVDEVSMMDVVLTHYLLKAIPAEATLVLVGDANQLPSVGPGNVLRDIIESRKFPVVELTEIFRQARQSRIVTSAHQVLNGEFPRLDPSGGPLQDFYFIEKEDPEEAVQTILKLCTERIPARFGFDPVEGVQVLSPMHRGTAGAQRLNSALQEALNPGTTGLERGGRLFRVNDKVMQVRNNYDKDVYNGDLGRVRKIDQENQELRVEFDGRLVPYDFNELDEITLAYAISIHKAQGSEYPAVVFPMLSQHFVMLQRNLLYTAITRARRLVVIVGSKKALGVAIHNNRIQSRFTLLKERLTGELRELEARHPTEQK